MRRCRIGDLDLSIIDADEADTRYIHGEIFGAQIYAHPSLRVPANATIMDVGANIGLFALWAQARFHPRAIYCYEASPRTFACLQDNLRRLVDHSRTRVTAVNRAISRRAGGRLVLHQSTRVSGISTLLAPEQVSWLQKAAADRQLETHEVATTSISAEIAERGLERVDLLKIDVEGHFMEVLEGIEDKDLRRVRNIVLEVDYLPETGLEPFAAEDLLRRKGFATDCLDRTQANNLTLYAWRED